MKKQLAAGMAAACFGALMIGRTATAAEPDMTVKFERVPMEFVLAEYGRTLGRVVMIAPNLPRAEITTGGASSMARSEYLAFLDRLLALYGVGMISVGDSAIEAVLIREAASEADRVSDGTKPLAADATGLLALSVPLRYISATEAVAGLRTLGHGNIQVLDRVNSLLIIDTAACLRRMQSLLAQIDQPAEAREEPHIVTVRYAPASHIKMLLEQTLAQRTQDSRPSAFGPPGVAQSLPMAPGVIRAQPVALQAQPTSATRAAEETDRGITRGETRIVADDRTNIHLIITRPENMKYFEKLIAVYDVATAPDFVTEVIPLKNLEAERAWAVLAQLTGQQDGGPSPATSQPERQSGSPFPSPMPQPPMPMPLRMTGSLNYPAIRIVPDAHANALVIMAPRSELATIKEILKDIDIRGKDGAK